MTRLLLAFLLTMGLVSSAGSQSSVLDPANGNAVMVAGELWDSFMPPNKGPFYSQAAVDMLTVIRVGNFDRAWTTPTHMWPGGWDHGAFWNKQIEFTVWDPSPTFNPATIGGAANPSYDGSPNHAYAAYPNPGRSCTIPGKGDPVRDYARETVWEDPRKRQHAVYQAGWPTNVGLDVKMKVHQYSLNWNNFNDFIIVEFTFTNTGVVDMNGDGTPEINNHVIEGLCISTHGEYMSSYSLSRTGGRGNRFGATRAVGWIGDPDGSGSPWNMHIAYPGESAAGARDMGLFDFSQRWYNDVWSAWTFLGAKDPTTRADFPTRFGTHAVGVGPQRGWFISDGVGKGFRVERDNSRQTFIGSMGTFFQDGGKSLNSATFDLRANSNFFNAGSTAEDLRTFVPKTTPARPNGDLKTTNTFHVATYEPGWTTGFTARNNFDGDGFMGIGPFKLNVGQSVTVTWVTAGGFRLRGVANAIAAARWTYEHDFVIPEPPPAPDMIVKKPLTVPMKVYWDSRAEAHPDFSGYKIYRAVDADSINWLETGMRVMDRYWKNTSPGPTPDSLKEPVNPNFAAHEFVAGRKGVPNSWGPYELIGVIPDSMLNQYRDVSIPGYTYSFIDSTARFGVNVWYYVAAYAAGTYDLGPTFAGYGERLTTRIESSNLNRNGASGLWEGTYPFADLNTYFPRTPQGRKDIGAPVRRSQLLVVDEISFGTVSVGATSDRLVTLDNSADEQIEVTVTITNALFSTSQNQIPLGPGESIDVAILYSPVSVREDTGVIVFTWNGIPYSDSIQVFGKGSGSGFYARPLWEVLGAELVTVPLPTLLASDQMGYAYLASMRDLRHFNLEKRSPSGTLEWTVTDSVYGSLPAATGLHISPDFDIYLALASSPPQVRKFNSSGVLQWIWQYPVTPSVLSFVAGMAADTAGNIYVTGSVRMTSSYRLFVAKINAQGNEEWSSMYNFTPQGSDDISTGIDVDDAGRVVVVGYIRALSYPYAQDIVVFRLNPDGVSEWNDIFDLGFGWKDTGTDIATDREGNVCITGSTQGQTGGGYAITIRYRSSGTLDWVRVFPDNVQDSGSSNRLSLDGDGNVYVVGSTARLGDSDSDYFTLRYDLSGNRVWVRTYDGSVRGNDAGLHIELDSRNDVYVSGISTGSTGGNEIATIKYSGGTGETVWEARYGRLRPVSATAMTIDPSGNVLVGGIVPDGAGLRTVIVKYGQLAVSVREEREGAPFEWSLQQNYPNPFNPTTEIRYQIPEVSLVTLKVFDILGREVATLVNEVEEAGFKSVRWDASGVASGVSSKGGYASGVYLYRLQAGSFVNTRKMLIVK